MLIFKQTYSFKNLNSKPIPNTNSFSAGSSFFKLYV